MLRSKFFITGASGMLGSKLCETASAQKLNVLALSQSELNINPKISLHKWRLGEPINSDTWAQCQGLLHCAFDFPSLSTYTTTEENINFHGTVTLFQEAYDNGVRQLIFISTQSVNTEPRSRYGDIKWLTEKHLEKLGVIIIRPGLIRFNDSQGLLALLKKISFLPIVPLPGLGNQKMYLVNGSELVDYCLEILQIPQNKGGNTPGLCAAPIDAVHKHAYTLKNIIRYLAIESKRRSPVFLPIPIFFVRFVIGLLEMFCRSINIKPPISQDSLAGLIGSQSKATNNNTSDRFSKVLGIKS